MPDGRPETTPFTRRFYRLMDGSLSWPRFDAMVARARRMRGWK